MNMKPLVAATLLALSLGAQAKADELGDKVDKWAASVIRVSPFKSISTNDWGGAEMDGILAAIMAKPVDTISERENSLLHCALNRNFGGVTPEKIQARKPIAAYLQASTIPRRALGGRTMELILFADEAQAQQLLAETEGIPAAASAAWECARRLGKDHAAFCAPVFAKLVAKGCDFPPYRQWFIAHIGALNPVFARRAIRLEQDAILADTVTPMTEPRRAWLDELELRVRVAKSKAQDPQ